MQLQLQQQHATNTTTAHYTTLHYTNCITLHYTPLHSTPLNYTNDNYSYNYNYATFTLDHTTHYTTLHYIARHSIHHHKYDCNYTTLLTLQHNYNSTIRYSYNYSCSAPHYIQQLWVRWPLQPLEPAKKNATPPTFRSISGFALPSVNHNNQPVSYSETSATALCGTTSNSDN